MNRRADQKRQRREEFKIRIKKTLGVFFCVALLISAVSITDMSTRRMIMCNDDKYAAAVALQEDNRLRIDIAGEKLLIDIGPVIKAADAILSGSKRFCEGFLEAVAGKPDK